MGLLKNLWRGKSASTPAGSGRADFVTRLYEKLAEAEAGKNLFLSPFSIQVALGMTAAGARGETRNVLANLIDAPESVEEQNQRYAALLKSVNGKDERPFELLTANALWAQDGLQFKPGYKKAIADFYDGAFNEVDFAARTDEAVKTINSWVSDKTRGKIAELVNRVLIKGARLVLTNAIYFKGKWADEFTPSLTKDDDWYGPGRTTKVPTMHRTGGYLYCEGDGFQVLDLPYKGDQLSMLIVLPKTKKGLTNLERRWAAEGMYRHVTERLNHEATVIVSLPRFKMETEFALKPVLADLGAGLAFTGNADFGGISKEALMISEVIHKAFVEVNEEGTEAAAATAVMMARCAAPRSKPEPKVFKADHPFMFFIRDRRTNTVLFSGRLLEPK